MYSSRGNHPYGQASYGTHPGHGQNLGRPYFASSGDQDRSSQFPAGSRNSALLGAQELEGYKGCVSSSTQVASAQYASVYGSASMNASSQVLPIGVKASGPTLEGHRASYPLNASDSPKFAHGDYASSSIHGSVRKTDQIRDFSSLDMHQQYAERKGGYVNRDTHVEPAARYAESIGMDNQYQASLLRQEHILNSRSLQSASLEGGAREMNYLAARGASSSHPAQEHIAYERVDAGPHGISMRGASFSGPHAPSILGAVPMRHTEEFLHPQNPNIAFRVSLPPGRDYASGKGPLGSNIDFDNRAALPRVDGHRDDRAAYLREFDIRQEERIRELLREREREKAREKDRERERERERERKRERERVLERKERERDRRRRKEAMRKRTPPKSSRDHQDSILKDGKSSRRDTPSREVSTRIHSPIKEKRREYICKIHASRWVDVERDYISVDRRYSRLFISPEFSKIILNWPVKDLKLSIQTPVSFEHDSIEDESVEAPTNKESLSGIQTPDIADLEPGRVVWNSKIILMSGLSKNAIEELSSEKNSSDRIPHICHILRFAVLKKNHALTAIGGPWRPVDGCDPSSNDSTLIQTALRYVKDLCQLDLHNCLSWNRFLEIHYDRMGDDGFFSHKEVSVFYIPDLSNCLPSLTEWRNQWLAHMKVVTEKERQTSLRKEKLKVKKDVKDKATASAKESNDSGKADTKKNAEKASENHAKNGADMQSIETSNVAETSESKTSNKEHDAVAITDTVGLLPPESTTVTKIIADEASDKTPSKPSDSVAENDVTPTGEKMDVSLESVKSTVITKKDAVGTEVGSVGPIEDKKEGSPSNNSPSVKGTGAKGKIKKKIIKRVVKKKITGVKVPENANESVTNESTDTPAALVENMAEPKEQKVETENQADANRLQEGIASELKLEPSNLEEVSHLNDGELQVREEVVKTEGVKENVEDKVGQQKSSPSETNSKKEKSKDEKMKDEKHKDAKDKSGIKLEKGGERKKLEEPPKHRGFILQTKSSKKNKLSSLSLSLDSLLDYSDMDVDDSSFELSIFAESFYEMLQYQMGSCILEFLQKLRIKFVKKQNDRKRQREKEEEKKGASKRSKKRAKTRALPSVNKPDPHGSISEKADDMKVSEADAQCDSENVAPSLEKIDTESGIEEDPDEDPEEYEEDGDEQNKEATDMKIENEPIAASENVAESIKEQHHVSGEDKSSNVEAAKPMTDTASKKVPKVPKEEIVDKELLMAFRFFDRNQVGYLRVEDMRLILHNLGKYLSHRDVKELVQCALLESNTARDDRVLYKKLVRMSDL